MDARAEPASYGNQNSMNKIHGNFNKWSQDCPLLFAVSSPTILTGGNQFPRLTTLCVNKFDDNSSDSQLQPSSFFALSVAYPPGDFDRDDVAHMLPCAVSYANRALIMIGGFWRGAFPGAGCRSPWRWFCLQRGLKCFSGERAETDGEHEFASQENAL